MRQVRQSKSSIRFVDLTGFGSGIIPAQLIAVIEFLEKITNLAADTDATSAKIHSRPERAAAGNVFKSDVGIKGTITFQAELFFDGKLEGEITSPGALTIGSNAQISGEIRTGSVSLLGKTEGNITAEDCCELKSGSELIGDLHARRLIIEDGASFIGRSEVTPDNVALNHPGSDKRALSAR
jgi:cytoskeletal protein CcmA (bactofilin family)